MGKDKMSKCYFKVRFSGASFDVEDGAGHKVAERTLESDAREYADKLNAEGYTRATADANGWYSPAR